MIIASFTACALASFFLQEFRIPCSIGHMGLAGKFEEVLRARRTFQGMLLKRVVGYGHGLQHAGGIGQTA